MKKSGSLRPLSRIEQAWTITDRAFPLSAVCILKLENGPSIYLSNKKGGKAAFFI